MNTPNDTDNDFFADNVFAADEDHGPPDERKVPSPVLRMSAFFAAGLLLVLVGIWILMSGESPSTVSADGQATSDGPRLALDVSVLDFGNVPQTEMLEETVTFRNVGDQDLVIEHVEAS